MKWEYHRVNCFPENESEVLTTMGELGWELVAVTFRGNGYQTCFYFKRPLNGKN